MARPSRHDAAPLFGVFSPPRTVFFPMPPTSPFFSPVPHIMESQRVPLRQSAATQAPARVTTVAAGFYPGVALPWGFGWVSRGETLGTGCGPMNSGVAVTTDKMSGDGGEGVASPSHATSSNASKTHINSNVTSLFTGTSSPI